MDRNRLVSWLCLGAALFLGAQALRAADVAQPPAGKSPGVTPADLQKDLVAHYPLDGSAKDATIGVHDGKVSGATPTKDRFGRDNAALQFDGVDDEVVISPPPKLSAQGFSLSVWVRFDLPARHTKWKDIGDGGADFRDPVVGQDDGYSIRCFQLWLGGDKIVWHRMCEHSSVWTRDWGVVPGRWYHCVATFDGKFHDMFVDGRRPMDKVTGLFKVSGDEPVRIGSKGDETTGKRAFLAGAVDDVRFYSRVLSEAEIQALSADRPKQDNTGGPEF